MFLMPPRAFRFSRGGMIRRYWTAAASMRKPGALLALVMLGPSACAPAGPCAPTKLATLPLEIVNRLPIVTVGINGEPARLVFDTGATNVLLERAVAERAGVRIESRVMFGSSGIGGTAEILPGLVQRLSMGDASADDIWIAVGQKAFPPYDGLLGRTAMQGFEFELDGPARTITVYRARYCEVTAPGWAGPFDALPLKRDQNGMLATARVGGVQVQALLDTGASSGFMTPEAAARVGVDASALERAPLRHGRSIVLGGFDYRVARIPDVEIGARTVKAPLVGIAAMPKTAGDMLIGSDMLLRGRLWIALRAGQVFLGQSARKG